MLEFIGVYGSNLGCGADYYSLNEAELYKGSHRLALVGAREKEMGRGGFEPPTHGFSVRCSTN